MQLLTTQEVGRLIAATRKRRGLTQADLANAIGASRFWVIRAEGGERVDLGFTLRALRVLGISLRADVPANEGPNG